MLTFNIIILAYVIVLAIAVGTASHLGKAKGGLTCLALFILQNIVLYRFSPVITQTGFVITPMINLSMIVGVLVLLFAPKEYKIGAGIYMAAGFLIVFLALILI